LATISDKPRTPAGLGALLPLLAFLAALGGAADALAQSVDAFNPLPNGSPIATAIQPDGKILIGGQMQAIGNTTVSDIARLKPDGSLDTTFIGPSAVDGEIKAIAIQPDGKILIGGNFDAIDTTERHALARLNADGTLDTSFADPGLLFDMSNVGTVWAIAIQPNGKIVVAGNFSLAELSTPRGRLARFNSNGTLDTGFADPQICDSEARNVALQANGAIVVAGFFYHIGNCAGVSPYHEFLARFSSTGSFESAFPADTPPGPISDGITVGPDGSIYVDGGYVTSDSLYTRLVSKLSSSGALISTYDDLHNDGGPSTFVLQPDGKLLIGGNFQSVDGQSRHGLVRLNANGSLDTGFADLHFSLISTNPNGTVFALASQTDGKVIATGNFTLVNGLSRKYMARVTAPEATVSTLTGQASGSSVIVTWTRSGSGPELAQPPVLMHSTNGVSYTSAGTMTRIGTGWQITAPYNVNGTPFYLRADGYTSGGAGNGSAGRIHSPVYVSDRIFADDFE
jgi:uncharacterized delta-60 repeat protein